MGNMEWIIGLGALAIGGWCFLAGPCKGWLQNTGIGTYGLDQNTYNRINQAVRSPEAMQLLRDYQSGRISENEMRKRAIAIGQDYASRYTIANM